MALIDLVSEDIVIIPLDSKDKPDVLRELVQVLKDTGGIDDFDTALKAVQDREDKQSTGLEKGIAVPHGKTDAVSCLNQEGSPLTSGKSHSNISYDPLSHS